MIDTERFTLLLKEAMGEMSQKDFAEKAGLSKFTLNKYLSQGIRAVPRAATLKGIADASDGRVKLSDLMHSVGIHNTEAIAKVTREIPEALDIPADVRKKMTEFVTGVQNLVKSPAKYDSIESFFETLDILYLKSGDRIEHDDPCEIKPVEPISNSFHGAEMMVPVELVSPDLGASKNYLLPFALFFCRTEGTEGKPSGIIFLDSAFDLPTLSKFESVRDIGTMLFNISEIENANLSNYPICLMQQSIPS